MKKTVALAALSLFILVFAFSCGRGGDGNGATANNGQENDAGNGALIGNPDQAGINGAGQVVTLRVFSSTSNTSGLMENRYWTDILERDLGIKLDLMPAGDQSEQRLAILMATRDFPDLVGLTTHKQVEDAIAAGVLLCLDDHQEQLPDVYANIPNGIKYYRENVSNGTGLLYMLPVLATTTSMTEGDIGFVPNVRWDLYKQLGMPELETYEDLIPLLQQMVEMEPVSRYGEKVYGYGIYADWDYYGMWYSNLMMNTYGIQNFGFLEVDFYDNSFMSLFDDNSGYKRYMDFIFRINQLGLLDPDSLTQRYGDYIDKIIAGRYVFGEGAWVGNEFNTNNPNLVAEGISIMPVFINDMRVEQTTGPNYIGHTGGWSFGVGGGTRYIEQALAYVNYMFSYDGIWAMAHGDQGDFWDINENGPYRTERSYDEPFNFTNGGMHGEGLWTLNNTAFDTREVHPGFGVTINVHGWQITEHTPPIPPNRQEWNDIMGVHNGTIPFLRETGRLIERDFAPMATISEAIDQIEARIADMARVYSWQMVFASDEEEYNAIWHNMTERAKEMNVDAANTERQRLYLEALEFGANYTK